MHLKVYGQIDIVQVIIVHLQIILFTLVSNFNKDGVSKDERRWDNAELDVVCICNLQCYVIECRIPTSGLKIEPFLFEEKGEEERREKRVQNLFAFQVLRLCMCTYYIIVNCDRRRGYIRVKRGIRASYEDGTILKYEYTLYTYPYVLTCVLCIIYHPI